MRELAFKNAGQCLSTSYLNIKEKLTWKCNKGHTWEASGASVTSGNWCPYCANNKKMSISQMIELADMFDGQCLSKEYCGAHKKLKWKCKERHIWEATPSNVKNRNSWCPICSVKAGAEKTKSNINEFVKIASDHGGKLLSSKYTNTKTNLKWECNKGHIFEMTPMVVKRGGWCQVCANRVPDTIDNMKLLAAKKGGHCLSKDYINSKTPLIWECEFEHSWKAKPSNIKSGRWCPKCAAKLKGDKQKLTIDDMKKLAASKAGECLSTEYINSRTKLKWRCSNGHEFKMTQNMVQRGRWCPKCASRISERICCIAMESLLDMKFPKSYPKWLQFQGRQLELDGYNEENRIAFEHQGDQHYRDIKFFSKNGKFPLAKRIMYDEHKLQLCVTHGIKLVVVPALFSRTKVADLKDFLLTQYDRLGIVFDESKKDTKIDFTGAYSYDALSEFKEFCSTLGYKVLSDAYIGARSKLKIQCSKGHIWENSPNKIINGDQRCPVCTSKRLGRVYRLTIEDMIEIASSRRGKCLSKEYKNNHSQLIWECDLGHKWSARPSSIRRGSWCPHCARIKRR